MSLLYTSITIPPQIVNVLTFLKGGFFMGIKVQRDKNNQWPEDVVLEDQPEGVDIFSRPLTITEVEEFFRRFSDIHTLLHQTVDFLRLNTYPKETSDIFETVTLYKPGFGRNWIPSRFQRQYMRIAAPVATAVNVSCLLGNGIIYTIPPIAPTLFWTVWDWPDQSSFYLDATATANQMNVWVRITNVS